MQRSLARDGQNGPRPLTLPVGPRLAAASPAAERADDLPHVLGDRDARRRR
ncbi:MAG: hypothetical protein LC667_19835 [Thioalkalivibrio sp.]|nr:hypothetical protein [Thioalkalivibrio sp.]